MAAVSIASVDPDRYGIRRAAAPPRTARRNAKNSTHIHIHDALCALTCEVQVTSLFLGLVLISGLVNFICAVAIMREIAAEKSSPFVFDLRLHVFRNLGRYRELTRAKHGRISPVYYVYLISFGFLLVSVGLLLNSLLE